MKKGPFLIFTAIILIAVIICIIVDYKVNVMASLIIGYLSSLAINAGIVSSENKKSEEKKREEREKGDDFNVGWGIGIGIGVGFCMALVGGFFTGSFTVCIFLFFGSVLGSVIGLMYKD